MTITRSGRFPVRDAAGQIIDLGAVKHVLQWNPAIESTLPSWLSTQGTGVFTPVAKSAGKPGLTVQGTSTTGSGAQIKLTEVVDLARLNGILFEVLGIETLTAPTTPGNVVLGVTKDAAVTTAVGAQAVVFQQSATPAQMYTGAATTGAVTDFAPNSATLHNTNRFKGLHLGVMLDCARKQFYMLNGDQFVGRLDARATMLLPAGEKIQPSFSFRPGAAGDQIHISGVRVTLWYD